MIHILLAVLLSTGVQAEPSKLGVESVAFVVAHLDAERRFYARALNFKDLGAHQIAGGQVAELALGTERIQLVAYDAHGLPIPSSARSTDRDFQHIAIIVSDMQRAWHHVDRFDIHKVSAAPQVLPKWNPAAGGIAAVYFRDPEGHPLELLHFPAGKGEAKWHATSPLFLGIDHTAIGVADTAASTRFYTALGFQVRGHSDNYGIEQQRLSGVAGAHVMITAVRFEHAPGVEFLHYIDPVRPQPRESARLFDIVATRTRLIEPNAVTLCSSLEVVAPLRLGCIVRDPDGHLIEIDPQR